MVTLTMEALCFKCVSSAEMFIYGIGGGRPLYYSPDGTKFYELESCGFSGSYRKHDISFDDPHHNRKGDLQKDEGTLIWGQKIFKSTSVPNEIDVVPLPLVLVPEYLFKLRGGRYIYVSRPKYEWNYNQFRLFIGKPNKMKQIKVLNVTRYRDGGTTYIKTAEAQLYSPTPFDQESKPTWDGEPITKLDPKDFVIEETTDSVMITKK